MAWPPRHERPWTRGCLVSDSGDREAYLHQTQGINNHRLDADLNEASHGKSGIAYGERTLGGGSQTANNSVPWKRRGETTAADRFRAEHPCYTVNRESH